LLQQQLLHIQGDQGLVQGSTMQRKAGITAKKLPEGLLDAQARYLANIFSYMLSNCRACGCVALRRC
jgi:hypothetical protein